MLLKKILLKNNFITLFFDDKTIDINIETFYDLNLELNKTYDIDTIITLNEYYSCYKYALLLISKKDYSLYKLKEKLKLKFNIENIEKVLKNLNFNENKNALNLIDKLIYNGYGPIYISHKLKEKGYNFIFNFNDYEYNIDIFYNKYINKNKQNLYRYLYSKGYEYDYIVNYLKRRNNE